MKLMTNHFATTYLLDFDGQAFSLIEARAQEGTNWSDGASAQMSPDETYAIVPQDGFAWHEVSGSGFSSPVVLRDQQGSDIGTQGAGIAINPDSERFLIVLGSDNENDYALHLYEGETSGNAIRSLSQAAWGGVGALHLFLVRKDRALLFATNVMAMIDFSGDDLNVLWVETSTSLGVNVRRGHLVTPSIAVPNRLNNVFGLISDNGFVPVFQSVEELASDNFKVWRDGIMYGSQGELGLWDGAVYNQTGTGSIVAGGRIYGPAGGLAFMQQFSPTRIIAVQWDETTTTQIASTEGVVSFGNGLLAIAVPLDIITQGPTTPEEIFRASFAQAGSRDAYVSALINTADVQRLINHNVSLWAGRPGQWKGQPRWVRAVLEYVGYGELHKISVGRSVWIRADQPGFEAGRRVLILQTDATTRPGAVTIEGMTWDMTND